MASWGVDASEGAWRRGVAKVISPVRLIKRAPDAPRIN